MWNLIEFSGDSYNAVMQHYFGDYRFSHTIERMYGGEPWWLRGIHGLYSASKRR